MYCTTMYLLVPYVRTCTGIGVTKDLSYQDTMRKAATIILLREGGDVSARISPEPTNPFDAHAVLFECNVGSGWGM